MRKLISICGMILAIIILLHGNTVFADAGTIEINRTGTLTIGYQHQGKRLQGLDIKVYRIADIFADGSYAKAEAFKNYPIQVTGVTSQKEWNDIAATLEAYAIADCIQPDYVGISDEHGIVRFTEVPVGIYLTLSVKKYDQMTITEFERCLSMIPYPNQDGTSMFDVAAYPKGKSYPWEPRSVEYQVVKQWRDSGDSQNRPESITIDIVKDDKVWKTVVLSSHNRWAFTWKTVEDGSNWYVVEREVPKNYTVDVSKEADTYIVTNEYKESPPLGPTDPSDPSETTSSTSSEETTTSSTSSEETTTSSTSSEETTTSTQETPTTEVSTSTQDPLLPEHPNMGDEDETDEREEYEEYEEESQTTINGTHTKTGDTTVLWPYILAMGMSGGILLIAAVWRMRSEE